MVITRFAPSPTGYLHIGNIRTALFCWLFAKHMKGNFYLRIDDTDQLRNSKKYLNNIIDVLSWLNLDYDKIIFQSNNYGIYKQFLLKLLNTGNAYKCFCDKTRLDQLKVLQMKNKKNICYDGYCRDIQDITEKPFVIRIKNDFNSFIEFTDIVRGVVSVHSSELGDFILAKNDYVPVYNFASVVDDINLNITHIIRGEDHVTNTIKQIIIMKLLNSDIPIFCHLPMILDANGKVLSKRNESAYMNHYIKNGFFPEAFLNYIIRLGWSYDDKEIFTISEMIDLFKLDNISKSPAVVNNKKLLWLNRLYLRNISYGVFLNYYLPLEKKFEINYMLGPTIKSLFSICRNRVDRLIDFLNNYSYFYKASQNISEDYLSMFLSEPVILKLNSFYFDLKSQNFFWNFDNVKSYFKNFVEHNNFNFSDIAFILRIVITGRNEGISIYDLLFLCGKILILKKIRNIIMKRGYSSIG